MQKWSMILGFIAVVGTSTSVIAEPIGEQNEVLIASLHADAGWVGFPQCTPESRRETAEYDAPAGWAIQSYRAEEPQPSNNGGYNIARTKGGTPFPSFSTVNNQFETLQMLARVTKNDQAAAEILSVKGKWLAAREGIGDENHLVMSVWANGHGSCTDKKGGSADAKFFSSIRYVGNDIDLGAEISRLREKYFKNL